MQENRLIKQKDSTILFIARGFALCYVALLKTNMSVYFLFLLTLFVKISYPLINYPELPLFFKRLNFLYFIFEVKNVFLNWASCLST